MDLFMDYTSAKTLVKVLGVEGFVKHLEKEYGYHFFSCSTAWLDDSKYICKLKGSHGDLVIGWEGIHN